jgi:hypothetical protein
MGDNDADICIVHTTENVEKCKKVVDNMKGEYLDWGAFRVYDDHLFVDLYLPEVVDKQYKNPTGELINIDLIQPIQKRQMTLSDTTLTVSVPNKMEEVLTERYGKNWRETNRPWYTLYYDLDKDF